MVIICADFGDGGHPQGAQLLLPTATTKKLGGCKVSVVAIAEKCGGCEMLAAAVAVVTLMVVVRMVVRVLVLVLVLVLAVLRRWWCWRR